MSDTSTPQVLYRIKDWASRFENNRTRELKYLEWVKFPNPMLDIDGFRELMAHENGLAHFGFWCACVFLASRSQVRGTLVRSSGAPHCPSSIAVTCGIPALMCREAAVRLVSLGWLEELPYTTVKAYLHAAKSQQHATIPQEGAGIPQEGAASYARANGTGSTTPPHPPSTEGGGANGRRPTREERRRAETLDRVPEGLA